MKIISTLSLALLFILPANAMTWDACVNQVSQNNPELKGARETLRAAEMQYRAAFNGFFPTLSASLGYDYGNSALGSTGTSSSYTASLSAKQNLFSGLADRAQVLRAGALEEKARATYSAVRAKISFDLKSAFAGLSFAKKAVALSHEIVQRREANLKLVDLRFQSGRENRGSALLSRAYLEQAKLDYLQASNAKETQRASLARVLGVELEADPKAEGSPPLSDPPDLQQIEQLIPQTPDYLRISADEKAADASTVIARSGFFPSLNLTGSTSNTDTQFFPSNNRWSVGVALVLPLFNGGKDYYGTKGANAEWRASYLAKENALRAGRATLRDALARFREAVQKLKVDRTFAEAAMARAKIAREKYNNGLLSFEDWDVIENDLISRQRNAIQSERDRVVAEAAWEQATGKGVIP